MTPQQLITELMSYSNLSHGATDYPCPRYFELLKMRRKLIADGVKIVWVFVD